MADEDTACVEKSTVKCSCENEWNVSQGTYGRQGWAQQAASKKSRKAYFDPQKARVDKNRLTDLVQSGHACLTRPLAKPETQATLFTQCVAVSR
jgi:hypothetical protein